MARYVNETLNAICKGYVYGGGKKYQKLQEMQKKCEKESNRTTNFSFSKRSNIIIWKILEKFAEMWFVLIGFWGDR